jgi:TPR repeat protein
LQINLLQAMNYPLISEYVEAIKMAEDNFEELSYLRPVLDDMGQPVMSSGNFAVVFKMRDERDGKLYAVRCFHRGQEGREESYRLIEEELKDVESPYLVSFRYMDKELFVDSSQTDETEFPVLLMDWVEGITLDKYLLENLDDQYALEMLAYRFSQLAQWLIPQPFAHGDLKPDNILVREDGTLVLVDYDGMYVPAMKGQKARELGSPDFRLPLRTEDDFDEHIDDFPLVSILLSLKAISINPQLLEEYGATDRLLFSEKDYRDIANSDVLRGVLNQMVNVEIARIYSLFVIVLSEKRISEDSYKLVFKKEDKVDLFENYKNNSRHDSESKYCLSCLLMNGFGCERNVNAGIDLIVELAEQGFAKAQFKLGKYYTDGEGVPQNYEKAILWYTKAAEQGYGRAQNNLGVLYRQGLGVPQNYEKAVEWLSKAAEQGIALAQGILGYSYAEGKGIEQNYAKAVEWYTKAAEQGFAGAQNNLGRLYEQGKGVPQNYEKAVEWLTKAAKQGHAPAQSALGFLYYKGQGVEQNYEKAVEWYLKAAEQGYPHAQYCLGFHYMKGQGVPQSIEKANEWLIKAAEQGHVDAQKRLEQVTKEDLANAWTDEYGVTYSLDGKRLLRVEKTFDSEHYIIHDEVRVICNGAFQRCEIINNVTIHSDVKFIGENAFSSCKKLANITIPRNVIHIGDGAFSYSPNVRRIIVDANNPNYDSRDNCNAIIETHSNTLMVGCLNTTIPNGVVDIGKHAFSFDAKILNITIPPSMTHIPDSAFYFCNSLTSVIIQNGVKTIGKEAFEGCLNMTNVVISDSITTIGEQAFEGCDKLKSITIPRSVTSIGRGAFSGLRMNGYIDGACYGYNNLDSIFVDIDNTKYDSRENCNAIIETQSNTLILGCQNTVIPNGITGIDAWAFDGCVRLKNIVIPGSVASIPDRAFDFCEGLTTVTLLNGIVNIGEMAFYGCNKLSSIVFPDSITSIGERAFAGCDKLQSITIPHSVSYIGKEAFAGVDSTKKWQGYFDGRNNIESIIVDERNAFYDSRNDCNAIIETLSNILIAGCKNTIIPKGVKTIGKSAFAFCEEMAEIGIPDGVTEIMDYAFYGCKSLRKVVLPNSIEKIGEEVFGSIVNIPIICIQCGTKSKFEELLPKYKGSLHEENLSTKVTEKDRETAWIDEYGAKYSAFKNRLLKAPDNINDYTIKEGTKTICSRAFNNYRDNNILSITIPDTITTIGEYAFSSCKKLISITIPKSVTSIEKGAFSGCVALERIIVEDGNPIYDSRDNCNAIIETRSNTLIVGCKKTVIPHDVITIGDSAFVDCDGLTNITLPRSVISIGKGAFSSCKKLAEITIFEGVTSIGQGAFRYCENLASIVMPNSIISIEEETFQNCKNLIEITIGSNVKTVGKGAFRECESLHNIIIPKSIENIVMGAFSGCAGLEQIIVDRDNPNYDSRDNCNAIIETQSNTLIVGCRNTIIPNSVISLADFALSYCKGLVSIIIPYSVLSIGDGAFRGCDDLERIEVAGDNPNYDSRDNSNAIIETHSNTLIIGCQNTVIPNSVKTIGKYAFYRCTSLTSLVIPKGVETIGNYAFYGCKNLKSVIIPNSVKMIGDYAFYGCRKLFSMTLPYGVTSIKFSAFARCENLTTIIIPDSVTTIGIYWGASMDDYKSLSQIIIPSGTRSRFEQLLPDYKRKLIEVDLNEDVTANDWTDECGVMYSVDNERLLKATKDLEYYSIQHGTKSISNGAFENCPNLKTIMIPNSVTSITNKAFSGCDKLSSIIIPKDERDKFEKLLPNYKKSLMEV